MKPTAIKKSFQYGDLTVTLETSEIARQATGAVMVSMGDTVVFVTVVCAKDAEEGRDFFPMTVNYQERTYAAGRIPGGFFRREGRPSEGETLTSRLIDRPIRPLFPKGFNNDLQIIATVVSVGEEIDPEIPCAWQLIYDRLESKDKLHVLLDLQPPKNWSASRDGGPRKIVREDLRLLEEEE